MKKNNVGILSFAKNNANPFLEKALEKINSNIVAKTKMTRNSGESAILRAVDEKTGEILGHTAFIRQIEVDEEQFAKLYLSQFSAFWELSKAAIRVFSYFLTQLRPNHDVVYFNIDECLEHTKYKSKQPIYDGLVSLCQNEIIARGWSDVVYYINPMCVFNGSRVTFAKTYVRKKQKEVDKNQLCLSLFTDEDNLRNFENEQDN